jgi:uncharacterized protein (DUF305 family)
METKPLLYGLIGFFLGGLLVSIAATTFDKPSERSAVNDSYPSTSMSMEDMTASLRDKTGDDYDKAFISYMIEHHQSAVDMAKSSAKNAKHNEIKQLSDDIIIAQQKEIREMEQWQKDWGYTDNTHDRDTH